MNISTFLVLALISILLTAILFGELRLLSKSVWPVFILHNLINGLSMPLILNGFIKLNGWSGIILSPTNDGIIASILLGVAGLLLYRYRVQMKADK